MPLTGLNLTGPLEVAFQVYDIINGMAESETLKYLAPKVHYPSPRDPGPKELKLDSSGQGILVKEAQSEQTCGVSGELDLWEAMTRRSLAFDACGIIDYEVFQKWVQYMFQVMRQPAPPGSSSRGSPNSFVLTGKPSSGCRSSRKKASNRKQTEPVRWTRSSERWPHNHTVMFYLLPTVSPASSKPDKPKPKAKAAAWEGHQGDDGQSWKKTKQTQWKQQQKGQKQWGSSGSGAGKLPVALKGCAASMPDGSKLTLIIHQNGAKAKLRKELLQRAVRPQPKTCPLGLSSALEQQG
eukprot:s4507_g2.t1